MTAPWDRRSASEHDRVQALTVSSWLPAATTFSPYWAGRAEAAGFEVGAASSLDDLARFRSVREADVRGAGGPGGPALLMRPTEAQVKARASSSTLLGIAGAIRREGREGARRTILQEYKPLHVQRGGADDDLAVASSRSDLDRRYRCGARAARVLGLDDADYLVNAVPAGPRLTWWGVHDLALGASILALHPRGAGDELERVVDSFALVPTTVVAVPVDEAIALAAAMVDYGVEAPRVHTVLTVGPPPDEDTRRSIGEAWRAAGATEDGLVVRALWAPPEARVLWAEPREAPTGLVTYPDLEVLEVVDGMSGEPVDGGGDLAITSAGWHGTALLRYQTGTWVEGIDTTPCPASGITAPRIVGEVAELAWQPEVTDADGMVRHFDFRTAGVVLAETDGVEAWRVELRAPTQKIRHDRVLVEVGGHLQGRARDDLDHRLEVLAGVAPTAVRVTEDVAAVQAHVDRAGSPFVDGR